MFARLKLVLWVLSALCVVGLASLVTDIVAQEGGHQEGGQPESVKIAPSRGKVLVGHTRQFEVSGNPAEAYSWAVTESGYADDDVGTVEAETGLFTALSGGYVIIAVMEEGSIIASTDTIFVIGGPTKIGKGRGGKVFSAENPLVVVDFPPTASDRAMTVRIEKRGLNELPPQAKGKGTAVAIFEFNVTDTETGENVGKKGFKARVRLTLHYGDEEVPEDVDEEDLVVVTFDEEEEEWEKVPEEDVVEVDLDANTITVDTDHASFWSVMDGTSLPVVVETITWGQVKSLLK